MLLPSCYLPPIAHFAAMISCGKVQIEQCDNYVKQTFRNRCVITGPNGTQTLTIPVEKPSGQKIQMRDLRISDHGNWRHLHWNALQSCYGKSPFFEYYADDLRPFYTQSKWTFLVDFNTELTLKMLELLDMSTRLCLTDNYEGEDLHGWAEPNALSSLPYKSYYQVFALRNGFTPHLSIVDLLFNMGPEALLVLNSTSDILKSHKQITS